MATDDKYDRQIRLWGTHGQKALMESQICMLGSSPCSTETLKNLVLPGIGRFTVVDSATVELADLGNNFFLEESDTGKSRAEAVCKWLQEMNPDVQGSHVAKAAAEVIREGPSFFRPFSLVIACQISESLSVRLGEICKELSIPLILITSLGFVGKLRVYVDEHCVCETKPDSEFGDLRLTEPFPELRRYADSIDIASLDDSEHAHVPYVVILIQALDAFRKDTQKTLPKTKEDKDLFKQIIGRMQRNPQEGNFDEALDNAYKAFSAYSIPDPVKQVLELKTENPKSDFWVVARAVSQFVRDCGKLPLAGTLPDMTASTETYVRLQEIYGSRAGGDCAAITAHVATIQQELGIESAVSSDYVKRFCQNAQYCEVFSSRRIDDEFKPISPEDGGLDLVEECQDEDSLVQWYIAFRAADRFCEEQGHLPGALCADTDEAALAAELSTLTQAAAKVVESYKVTDVSAEPKILEEVVRYGGAELHVTSSVLGGIAAQEAVKLLAKQYAPLMGVLLYDGLHGKTYCLNV